MDIIRCSPIPTDAKLKNFAVRGPLTTSWIWNDETDKYEIILQAEITFYLYKYGCKVTVFAGFRCDGGSVPQMFWTMISDPYATRFLLAFILHDALYASEMFDRATCDWIMLEFLQELGASWRKRNETWLAVRAFGGFVWDKHNEVSVSEARKLVMKLPLTPTEIQDWREAA